MSYLLIKHYNKFMHFTCGLLTLVTIASCTTPEMDIKESKLKVEDKLEIKDEKIDKDQIVKLPLKINTGENLNSKDRDVITKKKVLKQKKHLQIIPKAKEKNDQSLNNKISKKIPTLKFDQLLNLKPKAFINFFGDPRIIRKESPAEIWQYQSKICVLNIVFYGSGKSYLNMRAEYVETRDRNTKKIESQICINSILLKGLQLKG